MDSKILRNIIDENLKELGVQRKWNSWIKESSETIIAVILRKSVYGNQFYLRIKINLSDSKTEIDKNWVKHDVADILLSFDSNHLYLFDLDNSLTDEEREKGLVEIIHSELYQLIVKLSSRNGIIDWAKNGEIILLPYTKNKLGI